MMVFYLTDNQGVDLGSDINPTTAECVADDLMYGLLQIGKADLQNLN